MMDDYYMKNSATSESLDFVLTMSGYLHHAIFAKVKNNPQYGVFFFAINIILTSDITTVQNSSDTLCQDPGLSGKELHGNYLSWHQAFS